MHGDFWNACRPVAARATDTILITEPRVYRRARARTRNFYIIRKIRVSDTAHDFSAFFAIFLRADPTVHFRNGSIQCKINRRDRLCGGEGARQETRKEIDRACTSRMHQTTWIFHWELYRFDHLAFAKPASIKILLSREEREKKR